MGGLRVLVLLDHGHNDVIEICKGYICWIEVVLGGMYMDGVWMYMDGVCMYMDGVWMYMDGVWMYLTYDYLFLLHHH